MRTQRWSAQLSLFGLVFGLAIGSIARAEDPAAKSEPSKATFLITGMHCPPCAGTVTRSLQATKGVKSVKVDYGTQNARIEFDERVLPAQKLANLIATTPHMMGRGMSYGGWLALKVDGVQDNATADKAKEVLSAVKGVSKVVVYPKQQSVGIAFSGAGSATSGELLEALKGAGLTAARLP